MSATLSHGVNSFLTSSPAGPSRTSRASLLPVPSHTPFRGTSLHSKERNRVTGTVLFSGHVQGTRRLAGEACCVVRQGRGMDRDCQEIVSKRRKKNEGRKEHGQKGRPGEQPRLQAIAHTRCESPPQNLTTPNIQLANTTITPTVISHPMISRMNPDLIMSLIFT